MAEQIYVREVVSAGFRDKENSEKTYTRQSKFKGTADRINELYEKGHLEAGVTQQQQEAAEKAEQIRNEEEQDAAEEKPAEEEQAASEEKAVEEEQIKHTGGGYYELPNGEKVQGKENALKALADLSKDSE